MTSIVIYKVYFFLLYFTLSVYELCLFFKLIISYLWIRYIHRVGLSISSTNKNTTLFAKIVKLPKLFIVIKPKQSDKSRV